MNSCLLGILKIAIENSFPDNKCTLSICGSSICIYKLQNEILPKEKTILVMISYISAEGQTAESIVGFMI